MKQGSSNSQTPRDAANGNRIPFDPEITVVGRRVRREQGKLGVGDMVLGRYELLSQLGSGAMGVVFKCRDQLSKVEYALKILPPELASDADAMEDVRKNFQLIHGLKHPNIASTDFLDRDEYGAYFLLMEYAPGITLSQWIQQKWRAGRPDWNESVKILRQVASALDYAHRKSVLHRDVKPTNVMVDEHGEVKVLDFGLASKVRNTRTLLAMNSVMTSGTPCCLSPEQFNGWYPTPASDQYALGVLAYQMLAGYLPFESDDYNTLRAAVTNDQPKLIPGIPGKANLCIQKALRKEPKSRYLTCLDFVESLNRAFSEPPPAKNEGEKNAAAEDNPDRAEQDDAGMEGRHLPTERMERNRQTAFQQESRNIVSVAVYYVLTSVFLWICFLWFAGMPIMSLIRRLLPEDAGTELTRHLGRIIIPFSLLLVLLFIFVSFSGIFARRSMRDGGILPTLLTVAGSLASVGILCSIVFFSYFPADVPGRILLLAVPFLFLFIPLLKTRDKAKDYLLRVSVKPTFYGISWQSLSRVTKSGKNTVFHRTAHK